MARLWAWEAIAHGAEAVCYFRWRQAPFGQEQYHAGLLRPDSQPAPALAEVTDVAREIVELGEIDPATAAVALVFDYQASWVIETQPQGRDFNYYGLVLDAYRGLRRAGLSIDVVPPDARLDGYRLILAPGLSIMADSLKTRLGDSGAIVIVGPRSAAKTPEGSTPVPLPPALPGLDATVAFVESLPPGMQEPLAGGPGALIRWAEALVGTAETLIATEAGRPALVGAGNLFYLAGWPDQPGWDRIVSHAAERAGVETVTLPEGLRLRDTARHRFAFNYGPVETEWSGVRIPPAGVHWWRRT
jgi:beta-galactosidase